MNEFVTNTLPCVIYSRYLLNGLHKCNWFYWWWLHHCLLYSPGDAGIKDKINKRYLFIDVFGLCVRHLFMAVVRHFIGGSPGDRPKFDHLCSRWEYFIYED